MAVFLVTYLVIGALMAAEFLRVYFLKADEDARRELGSILYTQTGNRMDKRQTAIFMGAFIMVLWPMFTAGAILKMMGKDK